MLRLLKTGGIVCLWALAGCSEQPKPSDTSTTPPALGQAASKEGDPAAAAADPGAAPNALSWSATSPQATPPKVAGPTQVQLNLSYVTENVVAAVVVHPQRALASPMIAGLKQEGAFTEEDLSQRLQPFIAQTGLDPRDIEEFAILIDQRMVNAAARNFGLPVEADAPQAAPAKGANFFRNNLKQAGLAFHNYHDTYSYFPGDSGSGDGEHRNGFSWRVQLAPFMEAANVYNLIQFDEDWDSDGNKLLHEKMPAGYVSPGVGDAGLTSLHVFTGESTPFHAQKGSGIRDFTDGTSNTLLAVMAGPDTAENWMKPGGLEFDAENPLKSLGTLPDDQFLVLMADGSVRPLSKEIDPQTFAKLVTPQGNEVIEEDLDVMKLPSDGPFGLTAMQPDQAPIVAIKTTSAIDRQKLLGQFADEPEEKSHEGQAYYAFDQWALVFPTDHTALFGYEPAVQQLLAPKATGSTGNFAAQLQSLDQPFDLAVSVDLSSQTKLLQMLVQLNPLAGPFTNLQSLTLSGNLTGKPGDLLLALNGTTVTPEAAQGLAGMVNGLVLGQLKAQMAALSSQTELSDSQTKVRDMFRPQFQALEMKADGNALTLQLSIPAGFDQLPQLLAPEIKKMRDAVQQAQNQNNLRQIALAFHNYESAYRAFPKAGGPAEETDTVKDGLSWRVHLLPYLDQGALYNQFHFDEPWDSEHNKTLIEKMPDIYQVDGVDEPGKTSIFVLTGPGSPFADDAAPGLRDITDGTSNTLLCVVAGPDKTDIWTNPGGLDFDPTDPFAALGEIGETFLVIFMDGTVRPLPKTLDAETLRKLIQHADGSPVEIPSP